MYASTLYYDVQTRIKCGVTRAHVSDSIRLATRHLLCATYGHGWDGPPAPRFALEPLRKSVLRFARAGLISSVVLTSWPRINAASRVCKLLDCASVEDSLCAVPLVLSRRHTFLNQFFPIQASSNMYYELWETRTNRKSLVLSWMSKSCRRYWDFGQRPSTKYE